MSTRTLGIPLIVLIGLGSLPAPDPIPDNVKKSINRGIKWLLGAQNRDGSWGSEPGLPGDIANTTMVTITLLGTGSTLKRGKHHRVIRKSVDWCLRRIKEGVRYGGAPFRPHHTQIQRDLGHNSNVYYAALLLSQVIPLELEKWEEKFARKKLRELTDTVASLQKRNGGFETSYEPLLTTVTAWWCLRQSHAIGMTIKGASVQKVLDYIMENLDKRTACFHDAKHRAGQHFCSQAGGMRVMMGMGEHKDPNIKRAMKVLLRMKFDQNVGGRPGGEQYLGAVFAVQAVHLDKDNVFAPYYRAFSKRVVQKQNRDGSWTGYSCITARVFCTACAIIAMQTPNKLLPMVDR